MTCCNKLRQTSFELHQSLSAMHSTAAHIRDMSTSSAEIAKFIQQFVKQQSQQGAVGKLTGEKGYKTVESGSRYHFIIGLVIDSGSKTVQMEITKGHHYQALAPLHQYVLECIGV